MMTFYPTKDVMKTRKLLNFVPNYGKRHRNAGRGS